MNTDGRQIAGIARYRRNLENDGSHRRAQMNTDGKESDMEIVKGRDIAVIGQK